MPRSSLGPTPIGAADRRLALSASNATGWPRCSLSWPTAQRRLRWRAELGWAMRRWRGSRKRRNGTAPLPEWRTTPHGYPAQRPDQRGDTMTDDHMAAVYPLPVSSTGTVVHTLNKYAGRPDLEGHRDRITNPHRHLRQRSRCAEQRLNCAERSPRLDALGLVPCWVIANDRSRQSAHHGVARPDAPRSCGAQRRSARDEDSIRREGFTDIDRHRRREGSDTHRRPGVENYGLDHPAPGLGA